MTQEREAHTRPRTPPKIESSPHAIARQEAQAEGAQLNPADLQALQGMVGNTAVGQIGQIQRAPQNGAMLENVSNAAFDSILGRGQAIAPPQQSIQRAPEDEQNVPMDEDELAAQGKPNVPQLDLSDVAPSIQGGLGGPPKVPSLDLSQLNNTNAEPEAKADNRQTEVDRAQQQFTTEKAHASSKQGQDAQHKQDKRLLKLYTKHNNKNLNKLLQNPNLTDEAKIKLIENLEKARQHEAQYTKQKSESGGMLGYLQTGTNAGLTGTGLGGSLVAGGASAAQSALATTEELLGAVRSVAQFSSTLSASAEILAGLLAGDYKGKKLDLLMDIGANALQIGQRLAGIASSCLEYSAAGLSYVPLLGTVASAIKLLQHAQHLVKHGSRLVNDVKNIIAAKREGNKALADAMKTMGYKTLQLASQDFIGMISSTLRAVGSLLTVIPDPSGATESVGLALTISSVAVSGVSSIASFALDNYRAHRSQKAVKHYQQGRAGSEKSVVKHNFKFAAQIIIQQGRDGNQIALDELSHYGIHDKQLARKNDKELRRIMLSKVKESENPETIIQTLSGAAQTALDKGGSLAGGIGSIGLKPLRAYKIAEAQGAMGLKGGNVGVNTLKGTFTRDKKFKKQEALLHTISQGHANLTDEQKEKYHKKLRSKGQKAADKYGVSQGQNDKANISGPLTIPEFGNAILESEVGSNFGPEGDANISSPLSKQQLATNLSKQQNGEIGGAESDANISNPLSKDELMGQTSLGQMQAHYIAQLNQRNGHSTGDKGRLNTSSPLSKAELQKRLYQQKTGAGLGDEGDMYISKPTLVPQDNDIPNPALANQDDFDSSTDVDGDGDIESSLGPNGDPNISDPMSDDVMANFLSQQNGGDLAGQLDPERGDENISGPLSKEELLARRG